MMCHISLYSALYFVSKEREGSAVVPGGHTLCYPNGEHPGGNATCGQSWVISQEGDFSWADLQETLVSALVSWNVRLALGSNPPSSIDSRTVFFRL